MRKRCTTLARGSSRSEECGWQEFEARLQTLQTASSFDADDIDIDVEECLPNALKNKYKNREVSGNILHCAIDIDATSYLEKGTEPMNVMRALEAGAPVNSWMVFNAFGGEGCVMPIHLAAARGLIPAIKLLVDFRADVNQKSTHAGEPHFCPIHDAAFALNFEAVQCLLDLAADPNVSNKDGLEPCHLAAQTGGADIAELLVEKKARLDRGLPGNNSTPSLPINMAVQRRMFPKERLHILAPFCYDDYEVNFFESMLQICKENVPAAKALCGSILGNGSQPERKERVVKAVKDFGKKGQSPIPSLTEIIKLAPDVASIILDIFLLTPRAAAPSHWPLPRVANLREGEVMHTTYCADVDWKFDTQRTEEQYPKWHLLLAPKAKSEEDDCEVQVKYLSFPNLLDIRVLHALNTARNKRIYGSLTIQAVVRTSWYLVRSVIRLDIYCDCIVIGIFAWWAFTTLDHLPITLLINPGSCPFSPGVELEVANVTLDGEAVEGSVGWDTFNFHATMTAMSLLWALASREAFNFGYFVFMHRSWGFSSFVLMNAQNWNMVIGSASLISFLFFFSSQGSNSFVLFLFCANMLMRSVKLLLHLGLARGIGEQILPIVSSLRPMGRFFMLASIMNITFFGAFAALRRKGDDDVYIIFESLFFAMWAGDGNSFVGLRSLDHDGDLSLMLLGLATIAFTVCALNLMIAIFSKVYKENAAEADLLFWEHRCNMCEFSLLRPTWRLECRRLQELIGEADQDSNNEEVDASYDAHRSLVPYILSAACCAMWLFFGFFDSAACFGFMRSTLMTAALVLLQAAYMQNHWFNRDYYKHKSRELAEAASCSADTNGSTLNLLGASSREMQLLGQAPGTYNRALSDIPLEAFEYEEDFFVWICHRADFDASLFRSKRDELREMLTKLTSSVEKLGQDMSHLDEEMLRLNLRMDGVLGPDKLGRLSGIALKRARSYEKQKSVKGGRGRLSAMGLTKHEGLQKGLGSQHGLGSSQFVASSSVRAASDPTTSPQRSPRHSPRRSPRHREGAAASDRPPELARLDANFDSSSPNKLWTGQLPLPPPRLASNYKQAASPSPQSAGNSGKSETPPNGGKAKSASPRPGKERKRPC